MSTDAVAAMRAAKEYFDDIESDRADELSMMLDAAIKSAQQPEFQQPTREEVEAVVITDEEMKPLQEKLLRRMQELREAEAAQQPEPMSDERIALAKELEGYSKDRGTVIISSELVREVARALLSERPGWVSVPRDPTPEMWDAAWNSIGLPYRAKLSMHEIKTLFDKFHSAMLAAAPKETK